MSIKYLFVLILATVLLACSKQVQFPEPVSEKIPLEQITITGDFFMTEPIQTDSNQRLISNNLTGDLLWMKDLYETRNGDFDLSKMEFLWNELRSQGGNFSELAVKQWITATGFLFELTGNEIYVSELERLRYEPDYVMDGEDLKSTKALLEPYIFTRNNDFFHVNLFTNASVEFEHSLFGNVKITQETDFPKSGDVNLEFELDEKRYIEIFVRIPKWAEGATVTVKNVKYFAPPGDYCQIAKNWRDSDMVEIHLPVEKIPSYFLDRLSNLP